MTKFMAIFHSQMEDNNGHRLRIEYGPIYAETKLSAEDRAQRAIEKYYPGCRLVSLEELNGHRNGHRKEDQ